MFPSCMPSDGISLLSARNSSFSTSFIFIAATKTTTTTLSIMDSSQIKNSNQLKLYQSSPRLPTYTHIGNKISRENASTIRSHVYRSVYIHTVGFWYYYFTWHTPKFLPRIMSGLPDMMAFSRWSVVSCDPSRMERPTKGMTWSLMVQPRASRYSKHGVCNQHNRVK